MKVLTVKFEGELVGSYLIPEDEIEAYREALENNSGDISKFTTFLYELDALFEEVEVVEIDVTDEDGDE